MQRDNLSKTKKNGPNIPSRTNSKKPYYSSKLRDALPRRGRITLRSQPSKNDVNLPEAYNENKNKRSLPNRRRSSPRPRAAYGSFIREACGRNDKEGPCFDLNVQSNGYAWWYMAEFQMMDLWLYQSLLLLALFFLLGTVGRAERIHIITVRST